MLKFIIFIFILTYASTKELTLAAKAKHFQEMIEKWHLYHGQIRSVNFSDQNKNQLSTKQHYSDSTLVQGKYLAALSFQYSVAPSSHILKMIKRTLRTFYTLTHISGTPGLLCRQFYTGETRKNKHHFKAQHPAYKNFSYQGKGNRDQTTGYLWGLLCVYKFVDDDYCKTLSKYLLSVTVNAIYQEPEEWNDKWYYLFPWQIRQANTDKTIRVSATFKMLCLAIGHHIIKDPVYEKPYQAYFKAPFQLQSPVHKSYRITEYYSNNLKLMRFLSVLFLESDPKIRKYLISKVNDIYELVYDHQNTYFTYLTIMASDERNLNSLEQKYSLSYRLYEAKESLKQFNEEYLWSSLPKLKNKETQFSFYYSFINYGKHIIKGSRTPRPLSKKVLTVKERLPERFLWHRTPYILAGENDKDRPLTRRTGVDFLIAYWLGRKLRLIGEKE